MPDDGSLSFDAAALLGREPVRADPAVAADYVRGRRVLVTGAGGSIGLELCRQLARLEPSGLVMLDHDETALHGVQLALEGRALLESPDLVLCDIRDASAVARAVVDHRPEVVFHAAALKHLPLLERFPAEAVKTNVLGTRHLLDAAVTAGVGAFVTISTDKAADPVSVLGWTKRLAERLTAWYAAAGAGDYVSVRFGNVLGSRGSAVDTFVTQIEAGGPVTVTDPAAARYFMTLGEACELVTQAAARARPGEVLVLDMGEQLLISEVATALMRSLGREVDIVFTGRRPGEKLREDLFGAGEPRGDRPAHPLVSHVPVPPLSPVTLAGLPLDAEPAVLAGALKSLSELGSVD